jgi:putative methyltransferase (TIGR04325 family)
MIPHWDAVRRAADKASRALARVSRGDGLRAKAGPDRGAYGFAGRYANWQAAASVADGYDADAILNRVAEITRAAKERGCFERDGVLFDTPQWNFAFIACLLRVALQHRTTFRVLDFGGSLGTVFAQCEPFLRAIPALRWNIVEQESFAERGRREFQTETLRFHPNVQAALAEGPIDLCVLSGVLSYVPRPYELLSELAAAKVPWLLVDRTPVANTAEDQLTVQNVSDAIYGRAISYPAWIFSRERLMRSIEAKWPIAVDAAALDGSSMLGDLAVDFRLLLAGEPGNR